MPATAASAAGGEAREARGTRSRRTGRAQRGHEPQPDGERRQPAFGGDLHRHVVQMRVDLFTASAPRYSDTRARPCSARRRSADGRGSIASPASSIATRSRAVGSFMSNIDTMRSVTLSGATRERWRRRRVCSAEQAEVLQQEQQRRRPTHAPTQALRANVSASATISAGMHQRRPRPLLLRESTRATAALITSMSRPEYVM